MGYAVLDPNYRGSSGYGDAFLREIASEPKHRAILRSVIELAHALELGVVAEGVERPEQGENLRELGCDEGQGYFLSPPVDSVTIRNLLAAGSPLNRKLRLVRAQETRRDAETSRPVIKGVLNEARQYAQR